MAIRDEYGTPVTRQPKVYQSIWVALREQWRNNTPHPEPDAEQQRERREERNAHEIAARKARLVKINRILEPGTAMKEPNALRSLPSGVGLSA